MRSCLFNNSRPCNGRLDRRGFHSSAVRGRNVCYAVGIIPRVNFTTLFERSVQFFVIRCPPTAVIRHWVPHTPLLSTLPIGVHSLVHTLHVIRVAINQASTLDRYPTEVKHSRSQKNCRTLHNRTKASKTMNRRYYQTAAAPTAAIYQTPQFRRRYRHR